MPINIFTLWELVGTRIIVYLVFMISWGFMGYGSLIHHILMSHISLEDLQLFLSNLKFPFSLLTKMYIGDSEEGAKAIMDLSVKDEMSYRIFGSIWPILYIGVLIYKSIISSSHDEVFIADLILTVIFITTTIVIWRFGRSLLKT